MADAKSIDDLLVASQNPDYEIPEVAEVKHDAPDEAPKAEDTGTAEDSSEYESEKAQDKEDKASETHEAADVDEYGSEIAKPKMYTEMEVNAMIRDRLSRGRNSDQPTNQQVKEAAKDFVADPNSEETWEDQLGSFIDSRLDSRERKVTERQWQEQQQQVQADFEVKFSTGMNRHKDFAGVVGGKPITDSMMLAVRNMENPASFMYAACKLHPKEVERISRLPDAFQQAAEIGRLEERMKKTRGVTTASKPLTTAKGDFSDTKSNSRPSIDQLISKHAKSKVRR